MEPEDDLKYMKYEDILFNPNIPTLFSNNNSQLYFVVNFVFADSWDDNILTVADNGRR